jgi:hypothetical protein
MPKQHPKGEHQPRDMKKTGAKDEKVRMPGLTRQETPKQMKKKTKKSCEY